MQLGDIAAEPGSNPIIEGLFNYLYADAVKVAIVVIRLWFCNCAFHWRYSPFLIRIPARIADQMLPFIRDVLRHLCQELQRFKHLEIA